MTRQALAGSAPLLIAIMVLRWLLLAIARKASRPRINACAHAWPGPGVFRNC